MVLFLVGLADSKIKKNSRRIKKINIRFFYTTSCCAQSAREEKRTLKVEVERGGVISQNCLWEKGGEGDCERTIVTASQ